MELLSEGDSVLRLRLGVLCNLTGLAVSLLSLAGAFSPLLEEEGLAGTRGLVSDVPALESFLTLKDCDLPRVAVGPDGSGLLDLLKEDLRCRS